MEGGQFCPMKAFSVLPRPLDVSYGTPCTINNLLWTIFCLFLCFARFRDFRLQSQSQSSVLSLVFLSSLLAFILSSVPGTQLSAPTERLNFRLLGCSHAHALKVRFALVGLVFTFLLV